MLEMMLRKEADSPATDEIRQAMNGGGVLATHDVQRADLGCPVGGQLIAHGGVVEGLNCHV